MQFKDMSFRNKKTTYIIKIIFIQQCISYIGNNSQPPDSAGIDPDLHADYYNNYVFYAHMRYK